MIRILKNLEEEFSSNLHNGYIKSKYNMRKSYLLIILIKKLELLKRFILGLVNSDKYNLNLISIFILKNKKNDNELTNDKNENNILFKESLKDDKYFFTKNERRKDKHIK